jgi:hypothetical protein
MQQPALTPQQQAIQEVRTRYEHGDLSFDRFEYALNALLQAQTPEECQAIVQELPSSPITALDVVTPAAAPALANVPRRVHMLNVLGELKRTRRPWKMGQRTTVWMGIGALKLDLSLATLPPSSLLEVYSLIGEAKIYVPRNIHVTVRQFALLGENKALGEERNGIFTLLNEEEFPAEGPDAATAPHLTIHQMMLIGSAQVIYAGGQANLWNRVGARLSGLGINVLSGLGVDLRGVNLSGTHLEGVDLSGKNLEGARLVGSNLRDINLRGANLSGANLMGSNLEDANLSQADLSGANLSGCNLRDADLRGANLKGAKVVGANLNGANVTGVNLDQANLRGTNLQQAIVDMPDPGSLEQGAFVPPTLSQPQA